MPTPNRTFFRRASAALAAVLMGGALVLAAGGSPAQARCHGVANPQTFELWQGADLLAREVPANGVCDNDGHYIGRLNDVRVDGFPTRFEYMANGAVQVIVIPDGGAVLFTAIEPIGTVAYMRLTSAGSTTGWWRHWGY